jgi:hypothetical protein
VNLDVVVDRVGRDFSGFEKHLPSPLHQFYVCLGHASNPAVAGDPVRLDSSRFRRTAARPPNAGMG